jgi:hypothetical protein
MLSVSGPWKPLQVFTVQLALTKAVVAGLRVSTPMPRLKEFEFYLLD